MRLNILFVSIILLSIVSCEPQPVDPPPTPVPVVLRDTTIIDIPYGTNASQKLDLGLPANRNAATPLIIVIHGGGWATGDKNELTWLLNGMKQRGFAVANINYRLTLNTPDNYKMQLDDVDSAVQFTLRKSSTYTFNGQKLYIAGHSAGAHLSLCYAYTRNSSGKVKAAGSMAGPLNLFNMAYYNPTIFNPILQPFLGISLYPITAASEQRYKSCSPHFQATVTSVPTILFHGESDFFVTPDNSTNMATLLGTLGVDKKLVMYPSTFHDWWTDGTKTANTMDELKNWFNGHP
jgi:acetyl esterase/lipase